MTARGGVDIARRSLWSADISPPRPSRETVALATALFVWCVLATTIRGFSVSAVEMSRTRELMTVYAVALLVVLVRPWRWWPRTVRAISFGFLALVLLGYLAWVVENGSQLAINYWAQWLIPLSCYFLSLSFVRWLWPQWKRLLLVYACGIAAYQALALLLNFGPSNANDGSGFYSERSISATLALVMVVGMVIAATDISPGFLIRNVVTAFLGVSVVLAQHRSAWVALIVSCALLGLRFLRSRRKDDALIGPGIAFGFLGLAALLPLVAPVTLLPAGGAESDSGGLPASFEATGTLGWRWDMWTSRMQADRSAIEWILGGTFGETPAWGPNSRVLVPEINSHNMYVDLISMLGIAGLLGFAALLALALLRPGHRLTSASIAVWASVAFGCFYQWPALAWMMLAAALLPDSVGVGNTPVVQPARSGDPP